MPLVNISLRKGKSPEYLLALSNGIHEALVETYNDQSIVSVSLGVPAIFLWGGKARADKVPRIPLIHGDVMVWVGPDRLTFHGVHFLAEGTLTRPMAELAAGSFYRAYVSSPSARHRVRRPATQCPSPVRCRASGTYAREFAQEPTHAPRYRGRRTAGSS
jgi:2OG-Fe(II) oxygenase superfamily/Tautomerase enzyme